MIKINCDIGERGPSHPVDRELMRHIHIANIACGGHAGDEESVAVFQAMARDNHVDVAAHLSYPDRDHFGRLSMAISPEALFSALDTQYLQMPGEKMVKFHGALYNDACVDGELAKNLTTWLLSHHISRIITPAASRLARHCKTAQITVVAEAFAERRYAHTPDGKALKLVNRSRAYASIHDCDEALAQALNIIKNRHVDVVKESGKHPIACGSAPMEADTICIHSDSDIALPLAKKLAAIITPLKGTVL